MIKNSIKNGIGTYNDQGLKVGVRGWRTLPD